MRSRTSLTISSSQVQQWALSWLCDAIKLKDHGWKCTATVVWSIVLRAAAQLTRSAQPVAISAMAPPTKRS
jgi:hypothetical protein